MQNLRIPGPTPCPPEVLAAMGRQLRGFLHVHVAHAAHSTHAATGHGGS